MHRTPIPCAGALTPWSAWRPICRLWRWKRWAAGWGLLPLRATGRKLTNWLNAWRCARSLFRPVSRFAGRVRPAIDRGHPMSTVFEKLLSGEWPCAKVYEDDRVFAFMDAGQVNDGHVIVATKQPFETLLDMDEDTAAALMRAAWKIARAVQAAFEPEGITVLQANRPAGWQTVPHAAPACAAALRGRRRGAHLAAQGARLGPPARTGRPHPALSLGRSRRSEPRGPAGRCRPSPTRPRSSRTGWNASRAGR